MVPQIIEDMTPFKTSYIPSDFVNRENEAKTLKSMVSQGLDSGYPNIHLYGPRGSGKTHLTHSVLKELPSKVNTCYVSCLQKNTQYKALRQIYREVTGESIGSGHHISDLQRKIEERTGAVQTVITLDEIDFLVQNDGDNLLYFLSRLENQENIGIITISSNNSQLPIDERTKSSLQIHPVTFPMYSGQQIYEILQQRVENAFTPQSVHRGALTYISSKISNTKIGLHWLRNAAKKAEDVVTEATVKEAETSAYHNYVDEMLDPFTKHHKLVYQATTELIQEAGPIIRSGEIYPRYVDLCETYGEKSLSQRRISTYLKQLELLHLIEADYYYGGRKGKTREIQLFHSF